MAKSGRHESQRRSLLNPRGAVKNLALCVRDATYRSSFSRDADEVRVLITYTRQVW
jgi:hypothetical protein